MADKIQLGKRYRDTITGFTGTAVTRYDHMNGLIQYRLSPEVNEKGEMGKAQYVDSGQLVDAETGKQVEVPKLPKLEVKFGNEYRDRITGFTGKLTQRAEHVNGCVQYAIDPPVNEKGEWQTGYFFDDDRLMDVAAEKKAVSAPAPRGNSDLTPSNVNR